MNRPELVNVERDRTNGRLLRIFVMALLKQRCPGSLLQIIERKLLTRSMLVTRSGQTCCVDCNVANCNVAPMDTMFLHTESYQARLTLKIIIISSDIFAYHETYEGRMVDCLNYHRYTLRWILRQSWMAHSYPKVKKHLYGRKKSTKIIRTIHIPSKGISS